MEERGLFCQLGECVIEGLLLKIANEISQTEEKGGRELPESSGRRRRRTVRRAAKGSDE